MAQDIPEQAEFLFLLPVMSKELSTGFYDCPQKSPYVAANTLPGKA
jgi:hypothetical protein